MLEKKFEEKLIEQREKLEEKLEAKLKEQKDQVKKQLRGFENKIMSEL